MEAIGQVFWPEPLSPVFQAGGMLEGWNEDMVFTVMFMGILGVVDLAIVRPFLEPKSRYFALHAVANAFTAIYAFPDVVRMSTDPFNSIGMASYTMLANSAVASIHLYHCFFFRLRWDDIMHHAVFVSILCGIAIPFKHTGGSLNCFGCFFLSGLPGGIDFVLLTLVKNGWMDPLAEKKWNSTINTWMRGPSMAIYAFVAWENWITGRTAALPTWSLIVVAGLHFTNGQYYSQMAIGNYYERRALAGLEGADSEGKKDE